jgi:hypothetical protein
MSNELEKIKNFMLIKRDTVEETINDTKSTTFAICLIIIAIVLGVIQTLLQNLLAVDPLEWVFGIFSTVEPSVTRIILDAIMNNIVLPILVIVLAFYIGNAVKGEAESLNHVVRAIGYSTPLLIIASILSYLNLTLNPIVIGIVGFFNFAFGFWFVIVVIYALMIVFKKGALTGIGAIIISAIIAAVATGWTVFIL